MKRKFRLRRRSKEMHKFVCMACSIQFMEIKEKPCPNPECKSMWIRQLW